MAVKKAKAKTAAKISVTVCELMKDLKVMKVSKGATVEDVLIAAGLKKEGMKLEHLRVNGEVAKLSDKVKADDVITLVPQVEGGK